MRACCTRVCCLGLFLGVGLGDGGARGCEVGTGVAAPGSGPVVVSRPAPRAVQPAAYKRGCVFDTPGGTCVTGGVQGLLAVLRIRVRREGEAVGMLDLCCREGVRLLQLATRGGPLKGLCRFPAHGFIMLAHPSRARPA